MINTVRAWTYKPSRRFFVGLDREESPKQARVERQKPRFFEDFLKLWESHADLIVRNIQR